MPRYVAFLRAVSVAGHTRGKNSFVEAELGVPATSRNFSTVRKVAARSASP